MREIADGTEEGFTDLTFTLSSIEKIGGGHRLVAEGVHQGKVVGFAATLEAPWASQAAEGESPLLWGKVVIESLGAQSDALVQALEALYGIAFGSKRMVPRIPLQAVGLSCDPARVETRPVQMKLFFQAPDSGTEEEEGAEDLYAELYLNVDKGRNQVELREKDPDYRRAVLAHLGAHAG